MLWDWSTGFGRGRSPPYPSAPAASAVFATPAPSHVASLRQASDAPTTLSFGFFRVASAVLRVFSHPQLLAYASRL